MKRKYLIFFSLSGVILTCDQLTKHLIRTTLAPGEKIEWVNRAFSLTHVRNSGFVFGTLQQVPDTLRDFFFIGIPVFALILIILIFIKLQDNQTLPSIALTTILGGAVGNLIDRAQHGYVIDFVSLRLTDSIALPAFNIADCSIVVGVVIMFVNTMLQAKTKEPSV